jgi:hypothetical protein
MSWTVSIPELLKLKFTPELVTETVFQQQVGLPGASTVKKKGV